MAIKHLKPKTKEEIVERLKDLSLDRDLLDLIKVNEIVFKCVVELVFSVEDFQKHVKYINILIKNYDTLNKGKK
jgi:uncharacterized radical SAM superfamily protein